VRHVDDVTRNAETSGGIGQVLPVAMLSHSRMKKSSEPAVQETQR
jgi:hypothetical protein